MSENITSPLVSIIVPVYNQEQYLDETIGYIIGQTYTNTEIIFVDDGSTDKSVDIILQHAAKDSRIKLMKQNNMFAGVARNTGIAAAKGKYIICLDSDDIFEPELIESLVVLAESERADMAFCGGDKLIEATGEYVPSPDLINVKLIEEKANLKHFCPSSQFPADIYKITTPVPWNKLFLKSFIVDNKLEYAALSSSNDTEFIWTALSLVRVASGVDRVLVHYRIRSTSISQTKHKNKDNHSLAYIGVMRQLKERGKWKLLKQAYRRKYIGGATWHLKTLQRHETLQYLAYWKEKWSAQFEVLGKLGEDVRYTPEGNGFYSLFEPSVTFVFASLNELKKFEKKNFIKQRVIPVSIIVATEEGEAPPKWLIESGSWACSRVHFVNVDASLSRTERITIAKQQVIHGVGVDLRDVSASEISDIQNLIESLNKKFAGIKWRKICAFGTKKAELETEKRMIRNHIGVLNDCIKVINECK